MRDKVKNSAPWFVYSFQDLIDELEEKPSQQQDEEEAAYDILDSEALNTSPMHVEEIDVKAS